MADWCKYCKGPYGGGLFSSLYYTCSITGNEENLTDSEVRNYCMRNAYDCSRYKQYGPSGGGCFITTVTCEILNKKDDEKVMNNLRMFRDNVLQENEKFHDVLKEYDTIGPIVADKLRNDENKEKISEILYEKVLTPISELVSNKEYDKAVEKYYLMTLLMINYYKLKHDYNSIKENDYNYDSFDPKKAGHGKKLILKESNN